MHILNNIIKELSIQSKKQKDLCEHLGVGKQAFSDWKSGKSNSYTKYLPQIADYFGVSVDYLLGKEEVTSASPLDNKKKELFDRIDQMTDEQLEQLKVFIKYLNESKNK